MIITDHHIISFQLPAIASSNHIALQVHIQLPLASSKTRFRRYVDYDKLKQVISQENWNAEFHDCITTDEYAQRLTHILRDETDKCSHVSPLF